MGWEGGKRVLTEWSKGDVYILVSRWVGVWCIGFDDFVKRRCIRMHRTYT
jgi:hypothetical protein